VYFLGYSSVRRAYRVLKIENQKVFETLMSNCRFLEKDFTLVPRSKFSSNSLPNEVFESLEEIAEFSSNEEPTIANDNESQGSSDESYYSVSPEECIVESDASEEQSVSPGTLTASLDTQGVRDA